MGTASPKQRRCKLVVNMLLFLSVDMSLESLGANSFPSFPGPFPPTSKASTEYFSLVPKDIGCSWEFNCF